MNVLTKMALQLPAIFLMNQGLAHLGVGFFGQILLTIVAMSLYDAAEHARYEESKNKG